MCYFFCTQPTESPGRRQDPHSCATTSTQDLRRKTRTRAQLHTNNTPTAKLPRVRCHAQASKTATEQPVRVGSHVQATLPLQIRYIVQTRPPKICTEKPSRQNVHDKIRMGAHPRTGKTKTHTRIAVIHATIVLHLKVFDICVISILLMRSHQEFYPCPRYHGGRLNGSHDQVDQFGALKSLS